jgi:hypothetical protein
MRKILITFSGSRYHDTTRKIVEDGPRFGADLVWVYDDIWLLGDDQSYREDAEWLLAHPRTRGVGWFSWKSYIILDALSRAEPDDVVFYVDGDTFPIAPIDAVFDITAREGIMLFMANGWPRNAVWCKRSCFVRMGQDEPRYWDAHCGVARFMGFTRRHRPFLEEWYAYCLMPECNTFDLSHPELGPELPGFREHRCEQAIMTNLAHKYGHRLYREADEFGDQEDEDKLRDRDLYPRLFTQIYGNSYSPDPAVIGSAFRNV